MIYIYMTRHWCVHIRGGESYEGKRRRRRREKKEYGGGVITFPMQIVSLKTFYFFIYDSNSRASFIHGTVVWSYTIWKLIADTVCIDEILATAYLRTCSSGADVIFFWESVKMNYRNENISYIRYLISNFFNEIKSSV